MPDPWSVLYVHKASTNRAKFYVIVFEGVGKSGLSGEQINADNVDEICDSTVDNQVIWQEEQGEMQVAGAVL